MPPDRWPGARPSTKILRQVMSDETGEGGHEDRLSTLETNVDVHNIHELINALALGGRETSGPQESVPAEADISDARLGETLSLAQFLTNKKHKWKDVSNAEVLNLQRLDKAMHEEFPSLVISKTKLKQEARSNRLCLRCGKLGEPGGKCWNCKPRSRNVVKKYDMAKYFMRHVDWN